MFLPGVSMRKIPIFLRNSAHFLSKLSTASPQNFWPNTRDREVAEYSKRGLMQLELYFVVTRIDLVQRSISSGAFHRKGAFRGRLGINRRPTSLRGQT